MNNNILNVGLKLLVAIIAIIGIVLTVTLVNSGNPAAYDNNDIVKLGTKVAIEQGKEGELSQVELDNYIFEEGLKIKEKREKEVQANVDTIMNFTFYLLAAVVFVLILGTVFSIIGDIKKYLVGIISAIAFLILVYIIYATTSNEVPAEYLAMEAKELADNPKFDPVYTAKNWKLVSVAFSTTLILGSIAIAMWLAGAIMKIIK